MILKNLNISIKKGTLTAIVGPVGSGKSSLMAAVLGEMVKKSGDVYIDGTVAFVNQEAWIQNTTIESNILFGGKMDASRYNTILEGCALDTDIHDLPHAALTQVGERGVTLSGGQKQRISLARAIYSSADIFLLDDPISAVDVTVAGHIFHEILGKEGYLRDKTRIMVTNDTAQLQKFDKILVFENGEIAEQGSYSELVAKQGQFAAFLKTYASESRSFERSTSIISPPSKIERNVKSGKGENGLNQEHVHSGRVQKFVDYLRVLGIPTIVISFVIIILSQIFAMFANYWISEWAANPAAKKSKDYYYLLVYVGLGFGQGEFNLSTT